MEPTSFKHTHPFPINGIIKTFYFNPYYTGGELRYIVHVNNEEFKDFRLRKDVEGQWKMEAQALPEWIIDMEMDFNDLID